MASRRKSKSKGRSATRFQWRDRQTGRFVTAAVGASDAFAYEQVRIEQHRGAGGRFVPKPPPPKRPRKPKPTPTRPPEPPPQIRAPRDLEFEPSRSAEAARRNMQRAFEEAIRRLGLLDVNVKMRTVINADGTVDGELAIYDLDLDDKEAIATELQTAMQIVPDMWISLVWQLSSRTKEDLADLRKRYAEFKKRFFAGTHYSRSEANKWAERFATAVDILEMLKEAGRSVGGLLLRLYWSPTDERPRRFAGKPTKTRGRRRRGPLVPPPPKRKKRRRKKKRS